MPTLLFALVLTRVLYASLSIVPALALFFVADQLRSGENVEHIASVVGLCLSWAGVEGLSRRCLRSFGVVAGVSSVIGIAICLVPAGMNAHPLVTACASCAVGLGINCFLRERSAALALGVFAACVLAAGLMYFGLPRVNAPQIPQFIAAGVLLHGVVGLVLAAGYRIQGIEPPSNPQFSLRALLLFYVLLGMEGSVLYSFRAPATPGKKEREHFAALSRKASEARAKRQPGDALDPALEDAAAFAGKWQLTLSELEGALGPGLKTLPDAALWMFSGKEGLKGQVFEARLDENNRVLQMRASGSSIFITDPNWRQRQDSVLLFLLLGCASANLLLIRWWDKRLRNSEPELRTGSV